MKTYTTKYKTSTTNGTVEITNDIKGYTASFDGLNSINVTLGIKSGYSVLGVNLKDLHAVGFNCPNANKVAAIVLPGNDHKKMIKSMQEKTEAGKWCADGIWRTFKQIKGMNYTESVLAGEHKE